MTKVTSNQNAFTSGEWSPKAKGRFDLAKYQSGAIKLENFTINQLGGVLYRPGTRFIAETVHSAASEDKKSRLIPFQYSADGDYVIEAGEDYFKLYENDTDAVVDTQADTWTKLLIHANGNDGAKEIRDWGATGHIVTQVGTATLSTAQEKFGTTSLLLDGDSDYVTVPDSADWDFGTDPFTIEGWFRFTSVAGTQTLWSQWDDADNCNRLMYVANQLIFLSGSGGSGNLIYIIGTFAPVIDTWYHISIIRISNANLNTSWAFSVDGTLITGASLTLASGAWNCTMPTLAADIRIGASDGYFAGYIDEVRVSNVARNSADFTPDTSAYTSDANTLLLLHMDSQDYSSVTTPKIPTFVGTAQLNSLPSDEEKFDEAARFDGVSGCFTIPDHADWELGGGTGDFCIDFFVKFNSYDNHYIMSQYLNAANEWCISCTGNKLYFFIGDGSANQISAPFTPTNGVWYHVALERRDDASGAGNWRVFIDGVSQSITLENGNGNFTIPDVAGLLYIGQRGSAEATYMDGYLDEVRVSDVTRSNAGTTFTVPTAAYTSDANTLLLLHFDDGAFLTDSGATTHTLTQVGRVLQVPKYFGSGCLSFDGDSDYITVPDSTDWLLDAGASSDWTVDFWVRFNDTAGEQEFLTQGAADGNNVWRIFKNAAHKIQISAITAAAPVFTYIMTDAWAGLASNTWYHIAVVNNGTAIKLYIDGTEVTLTETLAVASMADYAGNLVIGAYIAVNANWLNGWIDELRISKGIARWSANFTVSTSEWALTPVITTQITTTYDEDEIFDLQYAQNNDILYIVHPDHAPAKLSRTSATAFSLDDVSFVRGPFMDTNITATTITASADTGAGITLTASADLFDFTGQLHIGSLWRINDGVAKITAIASATSATADVQAEPDGTAGDLNNSATPTIDWAEGSFSDYRGWPSAIAFHEQRLYYASTESEPSKFWGSYIGAYDSFDTTATTNEYSISFEVATEQRNTIKWMSSGGKAITIGTQGGTFSASSGDSTSTIGPDNIVVSRDTNYGVAGLMPQRISSFLYYVQRDYLKLRELSYSFNVDSTVSNDMTLLAEHVLKDGDEVVDIAHQQAPNDRIYCVRDDGQLAVLTRNPEQDVMGWSRYIAGEDSTGEAGKFESVCVIPKAEANDQVWVITRRVIDGTTKRFIEFFMTEDFDDDWDAIRCDSSLTLDDPKTITGATATNPVVITAVAHGFSNGDQVKINGVVGMTDLNGGIYLVADKTDDTFELTDTDSADIDGTGYTAYVSGGEVRKMVTSISGLDHLEGETVVVQTDGYIPTTETYTVTGGGFTLPAKAAVVHAGLGYTGKIQLLKLSDGSAMGTGQTKDRRIYLGTLRLYRTQGLSIGRTTSTLDDLNYNEETDDEALFTGDMPKVFQTTWDKADEIIIQQDKPLPANILCVILKSQVEEG